MAQDQALVKLEGARKLLAEARTIGEAKQVADMAQAAKIYAQRQKLGQETVRYASAIVLDAERRIGEMLRATEKRGGQHSTGGGSSGSRRVPLPEAPPTLDALGLDKKLSSRAQNLAKLTRETFEQVKSGEVTLSAAFRELPQPFSKWRKPRGARRRRMLAQVAATKERQHAEVIAFQAKHSSLRELLQHLAGELSTLDIAKLGAYRSLIIEDARRAHELLGEFLTSTTETTHANQHH